ncbi:MAG: cell division protein FtsA [Gemmatimonadetes bacterium]|nr:cell division protein FtsA [Gemmatimonadota bacterium]
MAGSPVVVLDVGASKVLCLVGEVQNNSQVKILGLGQSPCTGLRRSAVIDMPQVAESIHAALTEAERSTGLKIAGAYLGMAGEGINIQTNYSTVGISGASNPISEEDRDRALLAVAQEQVAEDQMVMHRFVQSYAVDGEPVQNPLWLHGNRLSIEVLTVSVAEHLCTAFRHAASKAGVEIVGVVLESVGVAHATLSQDERDMGVALLDLGAGTCDLAVFLGPMRHLEEIPLGGDDITRDLSVVLSIPIREAEKLKCRFGSVGCPGEDGDETVTYHTTAGRTCTLTKQQVSAVIEARQREIFEYVRQALINSSYNNRLAAGIVLTGGGALLDQVAPLAEEVLGHQVRIGVPQNAIAPTEVSDPSYATAIGLLRFVANEHGAPGESHEADRPRNGFAHALGKLFNFF